MTSDLGVVVIGLNEGKHLRKTLKSVARPFTIYVDSGSTDDSRDIAKELNVTTIQLDPAHCRTPGQARNAGFQELQKQAPHIKYVKFIDGDCELEKGWLDRAEEYLETHPSVGAVYGHLIERSPEKSVYNQLCQMEWKSAVGEASYFSGIVMMRVSAFVDSGGFRNQMIAGEDSELSLRVREAGYQIHKIDMSMAYHDADLQTFGMWIKRAFRSGIAIAQRVEASQEGNRKDCFKERRSAWFWGGMMPLGMVVVAYMNIMYAIPFVLAYLLLALKIYRYRIQTFQDLPKQAFLYSVFCILGKVPECLGTLYQRFVRHP